MDRRIIVEPPTVLKKVSEQSSRGSSALETNPTNRKDRQRDRNRSRLEAIKRWYSTAGAFDCNSRTPYGPRVVSSHGAQCARALIKLI